MQDKYTADITDFFKFLLLRNIEKETGYALGSTGVFLLRR
jgi:hypothetical protein